MWRIGCIQKCSYRVSIKNQFHSSRLISCMEKDVTFLSNSQKQSARIDDSDEPPSKRMMSSSNSESIYGSLIPRSQILDTFRPLTKKTRLDKMEYVLSRRCGSVHVLFENLTDPHNGAACMRTADGLGIQHIHAVESHSHFAFNSNVSKSADKWITLHRYEHCTPALNQLKSNGFTLIATSMDSDAQSLDEIEFNTFDKICVMFGNETRGLSKAVLSHADYKVKLPMDGFVQSYNLSVTCAIVLYHLKKLHIIKPNLPPNEMQTLYEKWILPKNARTLIQSKQLDYPSY